MRLWLCAVGLMAIGLTGRSAFASHGCGPWNGTEVRCIGYNGLEEQGFTGRDYSVSITTKPEFKGSYKMDVDTWKSVCRFPGAHSRRAEFSSKDESPNPARVVEHAAPLQCVEIFVHHCESPVGTRRFCDDIVEATIKEGK